MKVIVHFPESEEAKKELAEQVAKIHAVSVVEYINNLNLPEKSAKDLCDRIISDGMNN